MDFFITHQLNINWYYVLLWSILFLCFKIYESNKYYGKIIAWVKEKISIHQKIIIISTTKVSLINTIIFLLFRNIPVLIAYYIYDLLIAIYQKQPLLITHHIISLYALNAHPLEEDYKRIIYGTFLQKLGDLLLHTQTLHEFLYQKNIYHLTIRSKILRLCLIIWILFRVILSFTCYPFKTIDINIIAICIHIVNFIWIKKIYNMYIQNEVYLLQRKTDKMIYLY